MTDGQARIINSLVMHAPTILDTVYDRRRCIAATRHGIEALRYFGIDAKPVKTIAVAGNREWHRWMEGSGPGVSEMPDDAWSVGIDIVDKSKRDGYPGHLVMIAEPGILIDLNSGQLTRVERGMNVPDALAIQIDGPVAGRVYIDDEAGTETVVAYRLLPEKDWGHAPDWKKKPVLAGELIRAIKADLEEDDDDD